MEGLVCYNCNFPLDEQLKDNPEIECPKCGFLHKMYCRDCKSHLGTHIGEEHVSGQCQTCGQKENDEAEAEAEEMCWESPPEIPDPAEQVHRDIEEKMDIDDSEADE